ncbi:hypothetical protein [Aquisphaera insulae]|uniref:hypothetical protein n=1 Tax=Aquisphaera insulae TaxID=2712864 RepID=UPI0013EDF92B|nr:hypothetical protein [Aquisphaera insulae]
MDVGRIRKGPGLEAKATRRNLAVGFLRSTGTEKTADSNRRQATRVDGLFARPSILQG